MFNSEKLIRKVLFVLFGIAVILLLCLLATVYQKKESRDILIFLCTFLACIVPAVSLFLATESSKERRELIQTIERATGEIQNLRVTIAKLGKTNAAKR